MSASRWKVPGALLVVGLLTMSTAQWTTPVASGTEMGSAFDVSVPNIRVSHDGFPAHAEPSLATNTRNSRNLLGAAQLIGSTSNVGTYVSFDGGQTWHNNGPLLLPTGDTIAYAATVAFDAGGIGFVAALVKKDLSQSRGGVCVWRTEDGGRTFSAPVSVVSDQFVARPSLAADTTTASGAGNLYLAWVSDSGLAFSQSVDGGLSFTSPRVISNRADSGASNPVIAAGPQGAVYVIYGIESNTRSAGGPDTALKVISSTNDGWSCPDSVESLRPGHGPG